MMNEPVVAKKYNCPNKYIYDTGIIFECKNNVKVEITGEDVAKLLNQLDAQLEDIENRFEFSYTDNRIEFDRDELKIKDNHTMIHLKDGVLCIKVYIPKIDKYFNFKYDICGKRFLIGEGI